MSKNYVSNKELKFMLMNYYQKITQGEEMSEELASALMEIVNRIGKSSKYYDYTYLDDMKGTAIMNILISLAWKIDEENEIKKLLENPFSYISTIVFHTFNKFIKKEKTFRKKRNTYMVAHARKFRELLNAGAGDWEL